jgi:hypothetical protein
MDNWTMVSSILWYWLSRHSTRHTTSYFQAAPRSCQYYRPIDSPERLGFNRRIASIKEGIAKNMPEATWKPHEKHGRLTMQSDLPDSVYAFPKQRKEPLTDAQHVRNAVARFDQVIDVSDADRALAFANIEKAANHYGVNLAETSWQDLGIHPQANRKEATAKNAGMAEREGRT